MRVLLAIVLLAAAAWSGWWWWNASMREAAVQDWLAERRAEGWTAEAREIGVDGFPYRLVLTGTDLQLAHPEAGWSWQAPIFQVLSLTWKPNHFIAAWPGQQVIETLDGAARIESEVLRGSLVFEPGLDFTLERSTFEIDGMAIAGDAGWRAGLERALISIRQAEEAEASPSTYDFSFVAENLALPEEWSTEIDKAGVLPRVMEAAELEAVLAFNRPWDREAVEGENPSLEAVQVRDLRLSWGRLDVRGRGTLEADAEGYANGELNLRVRNWRDMLEVAVESELIAKGTARAIETGLKLLAQFSGTGNAIEVPLIFENGQTLIEAPFGAVPVGEAPVLARQ